jgi:hypothetical protein
MVRSLFLKILDCGLYDCRGFIESIISNKFRERRLASGWSDIFVDEEIEKVRRETNRCIRK